MTGKHDGDLKSFEKDPAKAMEHLPEGGAGAQRIAGLHYKYWLKTNTRTPGERIEPIMSYHSWTSID